MGRKRIEIALVKNRTAKQATFSKRRTGLFKKANELSVLCDAKVAIVVFSPGNKPHSFGHPAVNVVADEFLPKNLKSNEVQSGPSFDVTKVDDQLYPQVLDVMTQLHEDEKKSGIILDETMNQQMGIQISELEKSYDSLLNLKLRVESRISEMETAETLILFSQKGVEFPVTQTKKKQKIM